ncbi:class I SAM-dependent methyltransferase [Bdellovibrio bacteriovorus]|uniref:Putative SAM-dependent methyltransferase n=1 Tax=Bdellovibrio bacteriovorus str. Tiberius TaxID=1069642 RepID=K7YQ19_BDEBC|nr:methyltransferase domain-containing protein [Bdellovibrio bacteriovorus]AFY01926.1 putative SAM-dependent methyltransferase [Bdellovibrio bacteriovorus str. Tiberius]
MEPNFESPQSELPQSPHENLLEADGAAFPSFWQNLQNQDVLLVGWGHGRLAESLIQAGNTLTCIETSLDLISKARDFTESHHMEMIHGDFLNFPDFSAQQFSAVVTSLVAEPIKDLTHLCQQAVTVLKNDGVFYLSEVHPESAPPANHIHDEEAITVAATQAGLDLQRTEIKYSMKDLKALIQMWEFRTS